MTHPNTLHRYIIVECFAVLMLCVTCLNRISAPALSLNKNPMQNNQAYSQLATEMESALRRDVLGVWFPRSVDKEHGGFHSNFTRDWKPAASDGKFSVFQARMVWVAAQVVMQRPELKTDYLPIVEHG